MYSIVPSDLLYMYKATVLCTVVCNCHTTVCYGVCKTYSIVIGGALCFYAAGADTNQTELRHAGSHNSDQGYIPQVPQQV